eukprot:6777025-Pyramimonas_sp.AAC.1
MRHVRRGRAWRGQSCAVFAVVWTGALQSGLLRCFECARAGLARLRFLGNNALLGGASAGAGEAIP